MRVRFRGVRGSVPWSTDQSVQCGANTPCVEIRDERSDALLVLDAGTGIVGLGDELGDDPRPVPLLLSHYHWDHVQGLPFFAPVYRPGWTTSVIGPAFEDASPTWLASIFNRPYFPVSFDELASAPAVSFIEPGAFEAGGFRVSAIRLTHPGGSFAYRIRGAAGDLVYATDHEFGDPDADAALVGLASGAAAVIMDAHYTAVELPDMKGRGHGSWRQCAEVAWACGAGHLYLFHHMPGRTDRELAAIELEARRVFPATSVAREGHTFTV
jgi:phosphoribosyl 1,2-cyclic phosphodiesterase